MLDNLQLLIWTAVYIVIIIAGYKSICMEERKVSMPYVPGTLNFAWELCALDYSNGFFGHVMWLGLDVVIFFINYNMINTQKNKMFYLVLTAITTLLLFIIFNLYQGILISVFVIDLIMAIVFMIDFNKISLNYKVLIAILKLLGDFFAGLYYCSQSLIVAIIAVVVFIINSVYLSKCIKEKRSTVTIMR